MEQQTYEQILAGINREEAAKFVAGALAYLGGKSDWGSDEWAGVCEGLHGFEPAGAPAFGNDSDESLKFWGTISLELGCESDYEPDEQDEEADVEPVRVDVSAWRYLMQQAVRVDGQRPWPISVDADMSVMSGLGQDDGARLIGFQQPGVQSVVLMASAWVQDLDAAVGLEPVFSNGYLFVMQGAIVEVAGR
jgi:hypothetical protein